MPPKDASATTRFVASVILCVVGAAVVFGVGTATAWIGLLGLVIAGLNAALPGKGGKAVAAQATSWLRDSVFLRAMTIVFWIGAAGFLGYALTRDLLKRTIVVDGTVATADERPADGALVDAVGEASTIADGAGHFTLKVERWLLSRKKPITLLVRRGAAARTEELSVNGELLRVRVNLPVDRAAFRVVYKRLAGRAVDLFLNPPRRETWDDDLHGRVFIAANSVYAELKQMAHDFAQPGRKSVYYVRGNNDPAAAERLANDPPDRASFAGSSGDDAGNNFSPHLELAVTGPDIESLADPGVPWHSYRKASEDPRPETKHLFRRPVSRADFARSEKALARFWRYITREGIPPDFATVSLSLGPPWCTDEEHQWDPWMTITGRLLLLDMAVIENTASYPLAIGDFEVRSFDGTGLRPQSDDDARLAQAASRVERPFSIEILQPGEKIAIPLRMGLQFPDDQTPSGSDSPPATDLTKSVGLLDFHGHWVDTTALSNRMASDPSSARVLESYIYGPSYSIDSIHIGDLSYPLRPQPGSYTLVESSNEEGSCPFFFGYSRDFGRWISGGTILYNRWAPSRAGTDERLLAAFDGRVRITEKERETSFIDRLYVVALGRNGSRTILHARDTRLRAVDGDRITLHYGEEITVKFDAAPADAITFLLGATGYYIPGDAAIAPPPPPRGATLSSKGTNPRNASGRVGT
jgi:hypothetical protein